MLTGSELLNAPYWLRRVDHVASTTDSKVEQWPSLAAEVTVTAGTPAWTSGTYSQVFAASTITVPFVVAGLAVTPDLATEDFEIDVAAGAATSEVVVGTLRGGVTIETAVGVFAPTWHPFRYAPFVAANARLALRSRDASASRVQRAYLHTQRIGARPGRMKDLVGWSPVVQGAQPSAATITNSTASTTAYTYGSYSQVIASTTGANTLVGVLSRGYQSGLNAVTRKLLQVALGAATSEVVIWEGAGYYNWQTSVGPIPPLPFTIPAPLYIAGSSRIAIRCANNNASAVQHQAAVALSPHPMR